MALLSCMCVCALCCHFDQNTCICVGIDSLCQQKDIWFCALARLELSCIYTVIQRSHNIVFLRLVWIKESKFHSLVLTNFSFKFVFLIFDFCLYRHTHVVRISDIHWLKLIFFIANKSAVFFDNHKLCTVNDDVWMGERKNDIRQQIAWRECAQFSFHFFYNFVN